MGGVRLTDRQFEIRTRQLLINLSFKEKSHVRGDSGIRGSLMNIMTVVRGNVARVITHYY